MGYGMSGGNIPEGYSTGQIQQFDPKMMQLFKQLFSMFGDESFLSKLAGGDEEMFGEMEKPEWKKLQEQQGGLASQFSGMGGGAMSARRGSGFKNMTSQQSSDFANHLQQQRQQMQQMAISGLMGGTNNLLSQKPFENFLIEKPQ